MKSQDRASVRELPVQELKVQLKECEEKILRLRFANTIAPLKNGLELRNLRRHQARLITWIGQKEKR